MACGYVGILTADLHIPESGSLKDKRRHLQRIKADLAKRVGCAVAEVDHHDLHRRARLTLAVVTREAGDCDRLLDGASRRLHADPAAQVLGESRELVAVEHSDTFTVGA